MGYYGIEQAHPSFLPANAILKLYFIIVPTEVSIGEQKNEKKK